MQNDIAFSLNLSWRLASALQPTKANELLRLLSEAVSEPKQCIALWHIRTDWLIEALSADRFGAFFADAVDTLMHKLAFDGQIVTTIYVTSATLEYPFSLPEAEYQARSAG